MAQLMRVRVDGSGWVGSPGLMTFYFKGSTNPTAPEILEATARVRAALDGCKTQIPTTESWQVRQFVDVIEDSDGSLAGGANASAAPAVVNGTGVNGYHALQSMALVTFPTNSIVNGRRLKGRRFFGPLHDTAVANTGILSTSAQSALITGMGLLTTTITTPIDHAVWHRPGPSGPGSYGVALAPIVGLKVAVLTSRRD